MGNITIVTAFFDIGRGDWTPDKGLPHYLQRSTDEYLKRFSYMAKLDNPMVIFTSEDMVDRIREIRGDKPTDFVAINFHDEFTEMREQVSNIQKNPKYQAIIHPFQVKNPEYWNADYVLVNLLKSYFATYAVQSGLAKTELVAWLDFGYCRSEETLGGATHWEYDFDTEKIHLFDYKPFDQTRHIIDIISTNDVHILGAKIVASNKTWPIMMQLVNHCVSELLKNGLIDDDQTIMLMASALKPEFFTLHRIPDHQTGADPFVIFKEYNSHK